MTPLFLNAFFCIYYNHMSTLITFLNSETKLDKIITMFLKEFDLIWPNLDFSWGRIQKWMTPPNYKPQMTHISSIAQHSCSISIRGPHLIWPWPLLSIRPIIYATFFILCLLTQLGLAAVICSVLVSDNIKSADFDIRPDLRPVQASACTPTMLTMGPDFRNPPFQRVQT